MFQAFSRIIISVFVLVMFSLLCINAQGLVLGMTLFAIAIYGIFSVVGLSVSVALYVDDVAI
jgi:hypothetical protein